MAKIYERLLSTNLLWEKRRTRLIPNVKICDSICMVNLMEIPRVIVIFFLLHDGFASVFSEEQFCFEGRA